MSHRLPRRRERPLGWTHGVGKDAPRDEHGGAPGVADVGNAIDAAVGGAVRRPKGLRDAEGILQTEPEAKRTLMDWSQLIGERQYPRSQRTRFA